MRVNKLFLGLVLVAFMLLVLNFVSAQNLLEQWASSAEATSYYSDNYLPSKATGAFDGTCTTNGNGWLKATYGSIDTITLNYTKYVYATNIIINFSESFFGITKIELQKPDGTWEGVWTGTNTACPFTASFTQRSYLTNKMKITTAASGWNAIIDAVKLIGYETTTPPPFTCSENQTIMKLSTSTNAHGALWNDANYNILICYDDIFGAQYTGANPHTCTGNNKVVKLSDTTNAHAEIPSNTNYNVDVCYGNLVCQAINDPTACSTGESIVMRLNDTTNAHLANSTTSSIAGAPDYCGVNKPANCVVSGSDLVCQFNSTQADATSVLYGSPNPAANGAYPGLNSGCYNFPGQGNAYEEGYYKIKDSVLASLPQNPSKVLFEIYHIPGNSGPNTYHNACNISQTWSISSPPQTPLQSSSCVSTNPSSIVEGAWGNATITSFYNVWKAGANNGVALKLAPGSSCVSGVNQAVFGGPSYSDATKRAKITFVGACAGPAQPINFPIKICCKSFTAAPPVILTANWTNANGNIITNAYQNDNVKLNITGTNLPNDINYTIYNSTNGLVWFNRTTTTTLTWNANNLGTYYFTAMLAGNSAVNKNSRNLVVSAQPVQNPVCTYDSDGNAFWQNGSSLFNSSLDCYKAYGTPVTECCPLNYVCTGLGITRNCTLTTVFYCSDYKIQENCTADLFNVAARSVELITGVRCGSSRSIGNCINKTENCRCVWNSTGNSCGQAVNFSIECDSVLITDGTCTFSTTGSEECDSLGYRSVTWEAAWSLFNDEGRPDYCQGGEEQVPCLSGALVGFFGAEGLIIALILVVIFYLYFNKGKHK